MGPKTPFASTACAAMVSGFPRVPAATGWCVSCGGSPSSGTIGSTGWTAAAGADAFLLAARVGDHLAPGIDEAGVSPGEAVLVRRPDAADLRGSEHVRLVFDRARAQQHFPVRPAGVGGESGGNAEHVGVELPVQLWKAQVVADGQPQLDAEHRVQRTRDCVSWRDLLRLAVARAVGDVD